MPGPCVDLAVPCGICLLRMVRISLRKIMIPLHIPFVVHLFLIVFVVNSRWLPTSLPWKTIAVHNRISTEFLLVSERLATCSVASDYFCIHQLRSSFDPRLSPLSLKWTTSLAHPSASGVSSGSWRS